MCSHVYKPTDENPHSSPNFTELIKKAEELKAMENKELMMLDQLIEKHKTTAKDVQDLKAKNNAIMSDLEKIDKETHRQHQVILGRIDIIDKNDEDIMKQIRQIKENDEEMKGELEKLGKTDEECLKMLKEMAQGEKNILSQLKQLKENNKEIETKMDIFLDSQSDMFDTINEFSEVMKHQYDQLSIYDQELIKQQVQLGLMQDITMKQIDNFRNVTLNMWKDLKMEIILAQYIAQYSTHTDYLETAFRKFEQMNRYSFNLFVDDEGMEEFIENTKYLDNHIFGYLNMFTGKGKWLRNKVIFEDLNETCSINYIEKSMSVVKYATDLYDIRSTMVGKDVRQV